MYSISILADFTSDLKSLFTDVLAGPLIVGACILPIFILMVIFGNGRTVVDDIKDAGKAITNTQFIKDREEKKEVERLTRQVVKKHLQNELNDK